MAALSAEQWADVRAKYEVGATMGELSKAFGVDKAAISRRAKKECWIQDVSGTLDRLTIAKVNGIVNTVDPKKKAEALNAAAEQKAAVIERHRREWKKQEALADEAITNADFEKAKLAKITAETLKIRQEGERKAWGIKEVSESDGGDAIFKNVINVRFVRPE